MKEKEKLIIKIDDREPKTIELYSQALGLDIDFFRHRMNEGDYVFKDVAIERKQIDDFCGSLMNGRLEEQVKKMKEKFKKVFVIIVGHIKDRTSEIHENCILGMISKLVTEYDVSVISVDDDFQFLYLIKRIFERFKIMKKMLENEK